MIAHWTEKNRILRFETPLGKDALLLRSFAGHEAISQLFHFQLDLLSEQPAIDFDRIVGQNVTFSVLLADARKQRFFNGYVSRFTQLPSEERLTHYQAEVVPWPWFLTRTQDCRIFQNKSVPDIVQEVFEDFGFKDFELSLTGTYKPWEYCVQYRETAFNFVSRLLEQEGIFYFFKHEKDKHKLVLADSPSSHKNCPEVYQVRFEHSAGPGYKRSEDAILNWRLDQELRTGNYTHNDYNFVTPATRLEATATSVIEQGGNSRFEIYDYPGIYDNRGDGDTLAKRRMEEEEAAHAIVSGESICRTFISGFKFELQGYERRDQNAEYVLTSLTHTAEETGFYSGAGSVTEGTYSNNFTALPASVRFRAPRVTPKRLIHGSQTAVVVGPRGEEIYSDKYGRIKVQFHWDRRGQMDEKSSCWIRVSQAWAGKGWGAMWIPRIGQEVIVDFLEGDPDRPIISGRVYNAIEMPPYTLPDEQTKSTFKSYSSKGGGGFNELCFEDKKGQEQIYLHGEKDLHTLIKNDRVEEIGQDHNLTVQRDRIDEIVRDDNTAVKGKQAIKVTGSHSLAVQGNLIHETKADASLTATGTVCIKGTTVVIEGASGVTIKCGGSFVTVNAGGVFLQGPTVGLNSGGAALSASPPGAVTPLTPKLPDKRLPGQMAAALPVPIPPRHNPNSDKNKEKTAWIEIQLLDEDDKPVPGEAYQVTLPDGTVDDGTLDEKGFKRIDNIDPGSCQITFPDLDKEAWGPK